MTKEPEVVGSMKTGEQGYIKREDVIFGPQNQYFVKPETPLQKTGNICIISTPEGKWLDLVGCTDQKFKRQESVDIDAKYRIVKVIRCRELNMSCLF